MNIYYMYDSLTCLYCGTDDNLEEGDDDYEQSATSQDAEHVDEAETSSFRTAEGITITVVKGSITQQKVRV